MCFLMCYTDVKTFSYYQNESGKLLTGTINRAMLNFTQVALVHIASVVAQIKCIIFILVLVMKKQYYSYKCSQINELERILDLYMIS